VIGVDSARQIVSQRFKIGDSGPGRYHFPVAPWCNRGFFEQLCSEYVQTVYRRGRPERSWIRKPGRAAEAWDCAVYAYVALCALQAHGISVDLEVQRLEMMRDVNRAAALPFQVNRSRFLSGM
jgi:phage terminase large subunit GpA-like protein